MICLQHMASNRGHYILVTMFEKLECNYGGCQAINGVAGSGKSFLATIYGIAVAEQITNMEKVVYLASTSKMKDVFANTARSFTKNSLDVVSFKEVIDEEDMQTWDFLDEVTQKALLDNSVKCCEAKIDVLKKELQTIACDTSSNDANLAMIVHKAHCLKSLSMQYCKLKLDAMISLLQRKKVFVLTVDSFIKIVSGRSKCASIFEQFEWKMFTKCFI